MLSAEGSHGMEERAKESGTRTAGLLGDRTRTQSFQRTALCSTASGRLSRAPAPWLAVGSMFKVQVNKALASSKESRSFD